MIREHRMMPQGALAASIGADRHVIFDIERGYSRIDLDQAERIAVALRCTIEDLLLPLDAAIPRIRFRRREPVPSWTEVRMTAGDTKN
jgi:DNA-binding XRE family transcriptional regulator